MISIIFLRELKFDKLPEIKTPCKLTSRSGCNSRMGKFKVGWALAQHDTSVYIGNSPRHPERSEDLQQTARI